MIPSLNDQSITYQDWVSEKFVDLDWICDCCRKLGVTLECPLPGEPLSPPVRLFKSPIFVEISGIKYYSCSPECSRILFSIHHQYAMREVSQEKRFIDLSNPLDKKRPYVLDLDAVAEMFLEEHEIPSGARDYSRQGPSDNDLMWVVWKTQEDVEPRYAPQVVSRYRANEILALWKARPARSLNVVPVVVKPS